MEPSAPESEIPSTNEPPPSAPPPPIWRDDGDGPLLPPAEGCEEDEIDDNVTEPEGPKGP